MKPAEQNMKKYRKARPGIGTASARLFAALTGGMTGNLSNISDLKSLGRGISDSIFGSEAEQDMFRKKLEEIYGSNPTQEQIAEFAKNYPYSNEYLEARKKEAYDLFEKAWDSVLNEMRTVNLNAAAGSDSYRQARMNQPKNETGTDRSKVKVGGSGTEKN